MAGARPLMAEPIDELVQRWKQSPSPAATIALCDALRATPRGPLVQQVGEFATQRHATDVGVLVAVARMYLESHRLGDAQAVLVAAGKQAPRDGVIYRWLGEVLLRRGDAERAEKVLERAIQLGARDQDAQLWMERARVFRPMQAKAGTRAVAAEVAHATAHPMRPPLDSMSDSTTAVHVRPIQDSSPDSAGDEEPTRAGPLPPIPAAGVPSRAMPPIPAPPIPAAPMPPRYAKEAETAPHAFQPPGPPMPPMSPIMRAPAPSASGEIEISVQQPLPTSPAIPKRSGNPFEQATNGAPPSHGPFPPYQVQQRAPGGPMVPHPRDVLDALALSGVFEPPTERSVAAAAWANANLGPKRKGGPTLIVGMVLFLAASVGIYFFYRHKRAEEHVQAEAVLDKVEAELHAGKPGTLPDVQKELSQAFQLESRSPRGALDWTRERALVGLVTSGADVAFEDAMARNKDVGVPEEKYAFARVASFLFQGDTAGAAAVFVQFYQSTHTNATPSPALVKAALINSADELDEANGGPGPVPNNDEGWGRINLTNIIVPNVSTAPRYYQYLDQTVLLTNSQVFAQHIFVHGSDQPLKITLAYTDVPGFPGALPALVNDLDLEVVGPDGTLYRGNQFGAGESVPNAPTADQLNNVEGVYLSQPAPGDYLVRVRASKVVQDARLDTAAIDQDFALVSSSDLARPGTGFILLDRASYTAPGVMQIEVFDAARAASNSVSVMITNLTKHLGTAVVLHSAGNYGVFTGAVATVIGSAGAGQIQIANGDSLEADYFDSSGTKRIATATADLVPPAISGVTASADLGVLTITWQTTEPANSIVQYGTNSANLNLAVTNAALVTSHVVRLTKLIPGATYYYLVSSSDAAGNTDLDNNSGAFFNLIGHATPTVLLVDDYDTTAEEANGATVIPDGSYTNVLAAAGVSYGFWKVNERGGPQLADLQPFPVVIWRTTDDIINYGVDADGLPDPTATNNTLNAQQQYMIQTYLNGGGAFFMASMQILTQLGDVPFRRNVLQVAGFIQNPDPPAPDPTGDEDFGVPAILGAPASIANGINQTLDYSSYPSFDDGFGDVFGPDFSDTFTPSANATAITLESVSGKPCGMSYPNNGVDSPGRVVFMGFPFDTIPTSGPAMNSAVGLLRNIINFLAPGANGVGVVFLDNTVYTTNDVVTVEVGDSDLAGTGQTTASFQASSRVNQTTVTLFETTHPGLFRGTITLVAGSAGTNQLQVQNGDTLTASYFDFSNKSNVTAVATIDTVPPVISQVAATTDYSNAKITWLTSKPTDASVQYGLSQLPDHAAYVGTLGTNHAVTISGLSANRIYYYEVVSRDQAGNTTVDDNHGNLYTFQTLKAPAPPWFDNLESGAPGWTVVPDPTYGSDINWTLGTPNNGLVNSAYSGTNAWGSDLDGDQNFFLASSYLYSPVIDLNGLKSATLTFYDACDFSDIYEDGVVYVSTNSSTPPGSLQMAPNGDLSGAFDLWDQETVDLTPWVGQTIQVVFYYEGVEFGNTVNGWTIDDISITGESSGGNISITKNLGQGTWSLFSLSPIGLVPVQSGTAPSVTISNLPAGQYVVQFSDAPYYQTPLAQTNTLAANGTLYFNGNYSFLDANQNGISDAWEMEFFGSAAATRTQRTDSDGDGMSDYAEFIAGTDPTNPASRFYFTGETAQSNLVQMQWTVVTNRLYQVNVSNNLQAWQPATGWLQASNAPTMTYTVTNTSSGARFYRVQVKP